MEEDSSKNIYTTHTLACGLRIICARNQSEVVYCGMAVDAGTRDEWACESGMAHFAEHMSFKGTKRLSARQIINRMESVGGDLNAYTGKEETVYYSTFLKQHLSRAIDLLVDITLNSTFPQEEMEKEVEVVIDEIGSYEDQPSELIYDEFEEICFSGHPFGRNILGDADLLRKLTSNDMKAFHQRMYRPENMVLFVYGNVGFDKVVRLAENAIAKYGVEASVKAPDARIKPSVLEVLEPRIFRKKDTHQAHVVIGGRSFGGDDPRHLYLYLLNNMLGGPCMSSRLNLSLRERNGLVYTVESNANCYTDTGVWTTYFGTDPEDVDRCVRLVQRELQKLMESPLSQRTLDAARRQIKGQIGISHDNFESVAIGMAKRYLHYGKTMSMQQLFNQLDEITPLQLLETAQQVFCPRNLQTLIYSR